MDYKGFIGLLGGNSVEKAEPATCLDCSYEDEGLGTPWPVSQLGMPTDNCLFSSKCEISKRKTRVAPPKHQ